MWKTLTTRYLIAPIGSSPRFMGLFIPIGVFLIPGIIFITIGRSYARNRWHVLTNRPRWAAYEGEEGLLLALFYICVGVSFHFAYYWKDRPGLEKYSAVLSNVSLLIGFVFMIWSVVIAKG